jgi:methylated-DNA-[protein]-cysteine S-methyltransferase
MSRNREHERWRVDQIQHPLLPLLLVLDDTDTLVYVSLGARLSPLVAFAGRHGARLSVERRRTCARRQLREYLAGQRTEFTIPVRLLGTDFQQQAWGALCRIPYGETRSYAQQASALGNPAASRAVGRANSLNPVPIVVPCHRVIGHDGALTGFGGGLPAKRWLLDLEGSQRTLPGLCVTPLPKPRGRSRRAEVTASLR